MPSIGRRVPLYTRTTLGRPPSIVTVLTLLADFNSSRPFHGPESFVMIGRGGPLAQLAEQLTLNQ